MKPSSRPFPWVGRLKPWSGALRASPHRDERRPQQGVLADLPRDTRVTVLGDVGGWLHVQVSFQGKSREGFVSRELVEYVSPAPLAAPQKAPATLPRARRRLFFAIYYRVKDGAFKRAAKTWERETRRAFAFADTQDVFLSIEVGSESEFKTAWALVHTESKGKFATVVQGQIFSHASKSGTGEQNGLEFKKDSSEDGTVLRNELQGLAVLDWEPTQGHLILSGCNSGLAGNRGWTPAEVFAKAQKVRTTGQRGFAYFSSDRDAYVEITDSSEVVYLWAFKRRRNGWAGSGEKMEGVLFFP